MSELSNEANTELRDHIVRIAQRYVDIDENQRSRTFYKLAQVIEDTAEQLHIEECDVTHHVGIGPSSQKVVEQFLKSGTSERWESIMPEGWTIEDDEDLSDIPQFNNKSEDEILAILSPEMQEFYKAIQSETKFTIVKINSDMILPSIMYGWNNVQDYVDGVEKIPLRAIQDAVYAYRDKQTNN